jgi:hypothetical protein
LLLQNGESSRNACPCLHGRNVSTHKQACYTFPTARLPCGVRGRSSRCRAVCRSVSLVSLVDFVVNILAWAGSFATCVLWVCWSCSSAMIRCIRSCFAVCTTRLSFCSIVLALLWGLRWIVHSIRILSIHCRAGPAGLVFLCRFGGLPLLLRSECRYSVPALYCSPLTVLLG